MSGATPKNNPADFLKQVLGRPVVVKLNSGVDYHTVALLPEEDASTHGLTRATTGPVVVDGESFLDALYGGGPGDVT